MAEATALDQLLARRRFYLNGFLKLEFLIERGRIKVVELPQARWNPVPGLIEALGDNARLRQRAAEELAKSGP